MYIGGGLRGVVANVLEVYDILVSSNSIYAVSSVSDYNSWERHEIPNLGN